MKTLIEALRCSATVGSVCDMECPWLRVENVPDGANIKPDYEFDGVGYWLSCNCEKIAMDAADELEKRMTLDEAIDHCVNEVDALMERGCNDCAMEHSQLAAWLIELKKKRCDEMKSKREWNEVVDFISRTKITGIGSICFGDKEIRVGGDDHK